MSFSIADTSVLIGLEAGRSVDLARLPDQMAVSMVTIGELRVGALVAGGLDERERRVTTLTRALTLTPLPIDDLVSRSWAWLRVALRDSGRRMPVNDSWIAATALALELPVVTQDDDYDVVPGLEVIKV